MKQENNYNYAVFFSSFGKCNLK